MSAKKKIIISFFAVLIAMIVIIYYFRHELRDTLRKIMKMNYFTISELTASSTADKKGIDNTPSPEVIENLNNLIVNVLNPLRETYGKPILISSGYRSYELNRAVGGSNNSQHLTGEAADLVPATSGKGELDKIFNTAKQLNNFDQLILEENAKGNRWVHISFSKNRQRGQVLLYKNGMYSNIV